MNRKFVKILFFFLIIVITIGCTQKKKGVVDWELIFSVDKEVELEMILEDPVMPNVIGDIDYYKGKLVLMYEMNDCHVHFFNAETGEELCSALHVGRGPGELIVARRFSLDGKTGTFSVYDFMSQRFLSGNIDSLYNGVLLSPVNEDFGQSLSVFPLPQGYFFFQPPLIKDQERRYFIKRSNGEIVKYEGYPYDDLNLLFRVAATYQMGVSRDGTRMVAAASPGLIMEFFDLKNGIEKTHTRYFRKIFLDNDYPDSNRSGIGITDFYGTDKYIYATFGEPNTNRRYDNIAIFDWDGNPMKIFRTKYKKLFKICVDDEERLLYVVGEKEDGNYFLAKLDLSKH